MSIEREGDEAYPKTALSGMDRNSLPVIGDENWGETVLKVSVTNKGTTDATKIHLTPAVSNSWKLANGPQPIDRLAPGETRVVKFWARPPPSSVKRPSPSPSPTPVRRRWPAKD